MPREYWLSAKGIAASSAPKAATNWESTDSVAPLIRGTGIKMMCR